MRRHFRELARLIAANRAAVAETVLAELVAEAVRTTPGFNAEKFLAACNANPGETR